MARSGFESVVLVTGFPSLYVCKMVERILHAEPNSFLYLTVDAARAAEGHAYLAAMTAKNRDRVQLLEGSSTAIDLGLSGAEFRRLTREVDVIHHMVFTDDAAANRADAQLLNIQSAAEALEVARASASLRCLVFHSTAAVSGERRGTVLESELDEGQAFRSPALETRMRAERMIRKAMNTVPIAVLRPTTIVGGALHGKARPSARDRRESARRLEGAVDLDWSDANEHGVENSDVGGMAEPVPDMGRGAVPANRSSAGRPILLPREGEQLEGIHLLILLLVAARRELSIPLPKSSADMPLSLVPIDYAVQVSHAIGNNPDAVGGTFHIGDPRPPTFKHVIDVVQTRAKNRSDTGFIPSDLAKMLLRTPGIERFVRNPRSFVERLFLPVHYDMSNTKTLLAGTGIECPPFDSYVDELIQAVEEHIRRQRDRRARGADSEAEVDDPLL